MSSRRNKGGGSHKSKGQRLDTMARKRDERAARQVYRTEKKMESYLADDENFTYFSGQLTKMGLQLRDIPGDGNCLFRALGDQLEGHGRNHFKHRFDIVQFMVENRKDFEPFVEDDVPFDRYVSNLKKMGTYAGNDAIVAFARLHRVNVVIHQLNSPVWTIRGADDENARDLHISYHNGDHYSSVRKIGDNTESPAVIKLKFPTYKDAKQQNGTQPPNGPKSAMHFDETASYNSYDFYDEYPSYEIPTLPEVNGTVEGVARAIRNTTDVVEEVMRSTGCKDTELIEQTLEDQFYDVDATIHFVMQVMETSHVTQNHLTRDDSSSLSSQNTTDSGIWSDNGTGSRIFGGQQNGSLKYRSDNKSDTIKSSGSTGARPKQKPLTTKKKKVPTATLR